MMHSGWARRGMLALCALLLAACGSASAVDGGADVATSDGTDTGGYARRAAAQLQVEALPGVDGGAFAGRDLDLPLAQPDFVLTDTSGQPFDFRRDATKPVTLLYFGYASCPDVCPAHMAAISSALGRLPDAQSADVQVLFVSVDAVNDTPERLRRYLANFDPTFVGLTGTAEQVNAALASVGLPPTAIASADAFPPQHPSDVLAYTADGQAHVVYPFGTKPSAYARDLPALLTTPWAAE
jgi:protein SCO1